VYYIRIMNYKLDFESLFKILPERYVVFEAKSPDYTILAASSQYQKVTDKALDELIGKKLFDVFPDTSSQAKKTGKGDLQTSLDTVIETKRPESTGIIRYDLADENGDMQIRYWQATHYPIIEAGVCKAILQSTADVTEMVHTNEELRLANLKLEDALTAGLVGSWSWDIKKNLVTADKGLAHLFGVSKDEAIHGLVIEKFISSIHDDDKEYVSKQIAATLESGDPFEAEYRTIDTDGVVRWVIARGHMERDVDGEPAFFPGVMIDISSRKEVEAELKDSEQKLRFMADTMPQLVWITRPDGYHEYYNKHWYEYTGTKEGTVDGEGWNGLFHEDDQARAQKLWQHSLNTGDPYEIEYRLYHAPSKSYRWVIGRALPFKNEAGEIVKWYGTCTDIDDSIKELERRKQLEEALQIEKSQLESRVAERTSQLKLTNEGLMSEIKKRQRVEKKLRDSSIELRRSNKELEEFAYVSSHDLQEPLRKIQAFGDLLVEEFGDKLGDGQEYLTRIQGSAQRMSTLIDDLLTFSRVTTKPTTTVEVDLNKTMKNVLADLQIRSEKEKGTVIIDDNLPTVMADDTHMRQLFQNLLSNALKFHAQDRPPEIHVTATTDETDHVIKVKDNGIGIDEKYRAKVFAVFQRLNAKQAYEGTGIGLAVCKKIVERYGGTIDIESTLGEGTTFIITLPILYEE
jgi:PAS domain S-box-containing protein